MDKKGKKMIAPFIITIIAIIYFLFYFSVLVIMPITFAIKVLCLIIPLALIGVILYVLFERINEIRNGEEDDLSEY